MRKMLKGDRQPARFENVALAWPCTTLFRSFAQERVRTRSSLSSPFQRHARVAVKMEIYPYLTCRSLFSNHWLSLMRFSSLDRFSKYARDRTATSNPTLLQGERKAQQPVYSERERPRERIRTMIAVARSPLLVHQHGDLSLLRKI